MPSASWKRASQLRSVIQSMSDKAPSPNDLPHFAATGRVIGRTRFIVLVPVVAVILVSVTLFLLGAIEGIKVIWHAWSEFFETGQTASTNVTVEFLEVIDTLLRAVVFYVVGVGLFSLFISPLNLTAALGIESLGDLESKVLSVIVLIMAVTFLEHFTRWDSPEEILRHAAALALVVGALVAFQWNTRRHQEFAKKHEPNAQMRAQREMFTKQKEEREILPEDVGGKS